MRILVISNLFPPYELGGMEIRCKETVDRLRQRGHVCHILTSRFGVQGQATPENSIVRALNLQADIHYYQALDFFLFRPRQDRANRHTLRRCLEAFQPDVVFIWGMWNLSTQVAYWAEQWMPGRVAYAIAGYWLIEPDVHEAYWRRRARRPWVNVLMAPARLLALRALERDRAAYPLALANVACVSEYVRRKLSESGALPNGASVIYNGIDPDPFIQAVGKGSSRDAGLRLIYTGGLLPHKGVQTGIEALGLLQKRGEANGVSLTLVGRGHPSYEADLRRRVEVLGLQAQVSFHGHVPREQVASLLADHDVFLFTSIYEEPIARSVMEAMAAGLAVIGTAVGGQREMFEDGVNALVYTADDVSQLADCIVRLGCDQSLRERLSEAGRHTVLQRFTLDRMVNETEVWLETISG